MDALAIAEELAVLLPNEDERKHRYVFDAAVKLYATGEYTPDHCVKMALTFYKLMLELYSLETYHVVQIWQSMVISQQLARHS